MANHFKATDFRSQPDLELGELELKKEFSKPLGEPRADSWDGWIKANPKPELSSGQPEELTPNQVAERAASEEARKRLLNENEFHLNKDNRWQMLAMAVGCDAKDEHSLSGEELRAWSAGWRVGSYELDEDCPETIPELQSLWIAGVADGTSHTCLKGEQVHKTPMAADISCMKPKAEKRQRLPKTAASVLGAVLRTSAEIVDLEEMKRVWKAYKKNGGKLTFVEIEEDHSFNLKWANGMTAWRIIKKYERQLAKQQKRPA